MDEEKFYGLIQGVLAVLVVGSACAIAVGSVVRGQAVPDIPAWLTLAIGAILGFFFGQSGAQRFRQGVAAATNGILDGARKIAAGHQAQANGGIAAEESRSSS